MSKKYITVDRSLGLLKARATGIYYFRKYVTGVGRAEVSLSTKDEAEAKRTIFRTYSRYLRTPKPEDIVTIDDVVADIYEINQGKSQATFDNFEIHCRLHILPFFKGVPIRQVAKKWKKYVAFQHLKNPKRQLSHDRRHLVTILNYAAEQEYLDGVPKLKLDRAKRMRCTVVPYSVEDVQMILTVTAAELRERYPDNKDFHFKAATLRKLQLMFELGMFSGLRLPHEATALRFSMIDFKAGTANLPPEVAKTREGRIYPLDAETLEKLRELKKRAKSDFVFPKRNNPEMPATRSDKSWQRFKKALGLNKRLYWARHTHATEASEMGASEGNLKRDMGTSGEMLDKVYTVKRRKDFDSRSRRIRDKFFPPTIGEISEQDGQHA